MSSNLISRSKSRLQMAMTAPFCGAVFRWGYGASGHLGRPFLNVSRPYLVSLLEKCEIPLHQVGTHRRIYLSELTSYKQRRDEASRAAARELTQMAQEDELGHE